MSCQQHQSLTDYLNICQQSHTRAALVLQGDIQWQSEIIQFAMQRFELKQAAQIGGARVDHCGISHLSAKQGKQLLGQESELLVISIDSDFDANSFNAAMGTLVGGGIAIFLCPNFDTLLPWLQQRLKQLPILKQQQNDIEMNHSIWNGSLPSDNSNWSQRFQQQTQAIALVEKVLFGHRKRPLVITADRGRGKSSALGLAVSAISQQRPCNVLITAPSRAAVAPVFEHYNARDGEASLDFIAPDDLLTTQPDCDLLLIDEAAAIPVAMLMAMVEKYNRVVITTTIHGYEGCGRGFSLKFIPWLRSVRPGMNHYSMQQPIRWADGDPLESWCVETFLLNSELVDIVPEQTSRYLRQDTWQFSRYQHSTEVIPNGRLNQAFALLVNAHYQTSPNDLMLLLANQSMQLYTLESNGTVIGSVLLNIEGELSSIQVGNILIGQSRPQGHLIPVDLSNHLGLEAPAVQRCGRIMRIAVHPAIQGCGVGSEMLSRLKLKLGSHVDYLGTSFGTTSSLVDFWLRNDFVAARLGSSRDKSSGTYSLSMVLPISNKAEPWVLQARTLFAARLNYQLRLACQSMDIATAWTLFKHTSDNEQAIDHLGVQLLSNYSRGGNSLDTCRPYLILLLRSVLKSGLDVNSELVKTVALQELDWGQVCQRFSFIGRKQAELRLREDIAILISSLQCKLP
ncbi:GNAT family N-acetyltransferase [Vibrio hippocampi]|uniref:tRNA(Met) cytidine acetyltransferase TmcA n=1 Tax=Vibrio hippocampi TaxID=654686 RepID=A0ABN8DKS4_9VIBR|nr:GNAT family N-acetyltransferase [Vibrio hippocampi]CAH0528675.1 tRNA(Met) cytidine acetyltransferase TmcA [Vibrio hippocampi]